MKKGINKKKVRLYAFSLLAIFLLLLPLGQLLRIEKYIFGQYVVLHPVDLVMLSALPSITLLKRSLVLNNLRKMVFILISSWIFSLLIFKNGEIVTGFLYLLRIVSYCAFASLIYFISTSKQIKRKILKYLFISILIFLLFGFVQFIYYFDLRDLYFIGWDDHYFRLTSTFLDPGYTVVLLIIGLVLLVETNVINSKIVKLFLIIVFAVSILLTFSRAGYLATVVYFIYRYRNYYKYIIIFSILLFSLILVLPKPRSSGVEIYRTFSIFSRLNNYRQSLGVFNRYPLFGVGFNNICTYRINYLKTDNLLSHSCSSGDSSLLLLLSTTGVVGFLTFINFVAKIYLKMRFSSYGRLFLSVSLVVFVSSFFNNTLFYNFIMGVTAVMFGLSRVVIPDK